MPEAEPFRLLKLFPADDLEFRTATERIFAHVGEAAGPAEFERRLKDSYPAARVQVQERLGMNGAPRPHWYVFRDGRIMRPVTPPEAPRGHKQ